MRMDFFESQIKEMQDLFNSAYKERVVFDVRTRTGCMFGIIRLSLLKKDIEQAKKEAERRDFISDFVTARNKIREILNHVKEQPIHTPKPKKAKEMAA